MEDPAQEASLVRDGGPAVRTTPWPVRGSIGEAERAAVLRVMDRAIETGQGIPYGGPEEEAYRAEFAAFQGGGFAHTVNSGTAAVYVALRALELEPYTEIIVPPCTDPGSVMPVAMLNCLPVPADSAHCSLNVDAETIAARIGPRTSAIVAVHLSGIPLDMGPIMEVARRAGLPVLEDCAQAHGAMDGGRKVGTWGDVAAFSTMSTKHHVTGPVGGVVFTRDEAIARRVRIYADRGKPPISEVDWRKVPNCRREATLNFNLGDLGCAIGRPQLAKLPANLARRRAWVHGLAEAVGTLTRFRVNTFGRAIDDCSFWFALIRADVEQLGIDVFELAEWLQDEGVPLSAEPIEIATRAPWFRERRVFGTSQEPWTRLQAPEDPKSAWPVPHADEAAATHLMIEVHEALGEAEIRDVVQALRKMERVLLSHAA